LARPPNTRPGGKGLEDKEQTMERKDINWTYKVGSRVQLGQDIFCGGEIWLEKGETGTIIERFGLRASPAYIVKFGDHQTSVDQHEIDKAR
jgi:hypothetical protein